MPENVVITIDDGWRPGANREILFFWASWSKPSRATKLAMFAVADRHPDVVFNLADVDRAGDLAVAWGVRQIPTTIFFKSMGAVHRVEGPLSEAALDDEIRKRLA